VDGGIPADPAARHCLSQAWKLLQHVVTKRGDANVPFAGLCRLLRSLGFEERIRGDHHIFAITGIIEIVNLQSIGGKAKPYQVKQVRDLILRYSLMLRD